MTPKTFLSLLACATLLFTFTSCIEEDSGMDDLFLFEGELVANEAVLNGTGMPKVAHLESITYTSKVHGEITNHLGHVEVSFRNCGEEWCNALLNDCGQSSDFGFAFAGEAGVETIEFDDFASARPIQRFAEKDLQFAFSRNGVDILLSCADCPGVTPGGESYEGRTVSMKAVR